MVRYMVNIWKVSHPLWFTITSTFSSKCVLPYNLQMKYYNTKELFTCNFEASASDFLGTVSTVC